MFTLDQIQKAHEKVASGMNFPAYIREIRALGVGGFTTFVENGRTEYQGDDTHLSSPVLYDTITLSSQTNTKHFEERLRIHQSGNTDFLTFCQDCALSGIVYWKVNTRECTCIYYDINDQVVLSESFPA